MAEQNDVVAVLLMAYGGPDSLDDIEPYLLDVRGGRETPAELVEEIREHYAAVGGRSPLLERTQEQAAALEEQLNQMGNGRFATYVGMRHWHPYIKKAVEQILDDGVQRVVAIAMAPHYSQMSTEAYVQQVKKALQKLNGALSVTYVKSWNDHPLYLQAVAERIEEASARFPRSVRDEVPIIFTAHSLPARILKWDDPYPQELRESAEGVIDRLSNGETEWYLAYQSAGSTKEKWLGPDAGELLEKMHDEGHRHVIVAPIGFVCDHVEVLYDVDVEYAELTDSLGMQMERMEMLNASPLFIEALADIVRAHLEE